MIGHLEAALTDETHDSEVGYLIEISLDRLRANMWPHNIDLLLQR